jgi:hypothetical protein
VNARRRLRQRREVLARQRLHPRVEAIGRDLHAVLVLLDPDVGLRQRLDDLVELLGRQRQRPPFVTTRRTGCAARPRDRWPAASPIAVGLEQDVGKNRNRVLPLDDALEQLQFSQQIGLADDEFHVVMTSRAAGRRAALIPSLKSEKVTEKYNNKEGAVENEKFGR